MRLLLSLAVFSVMLMVLLAFSTPVSAQDAVAPTAAALEQVHPLQVIMRYDAVAPTANALEQVQRYERAIHVMAMLLVGFGFLMVFVKRYGRSALTATYLLTAAGLPLYFLFDSVGLFGQPPRPITDRLLCAEFAAASLLICAGAVLGRLKMGQYLILTVLFIPCYMANEWIVTQGGCGILPRDTFLDTGGSIIIHAFGAFFGLGAILTMTTRTEFDAPIESDAVSDRFSLLGSMVLWVFWPSFCSALVPAQDVPHTAINVILALCGATLATYFACMALRRKISPADIANATLAGGVAIGALCARPDFFAGSFVIGLAAGALSALGFAVLQSRLQAVLRKTDTCGVLYLHGLPGLLGGLAALLFIATPGAQAAGIVVTVAIAVVTGFIAGKVLAVFGRRGVPYVDHEELIVETEAEPAE
jgi:ammonium transporter Rh